MSAKMNTTNGAITDQTCRTCLQQCGVKSLGEAVNICGSMTALIYNILQTACSIQVAVNDGFPQKICESCEDSLIKFVKFRFVCEQSNQFLRNSNTKDFSQKVDSTTSESVLSTVDIKKNTHSEQESNGNAYINTPHELTGTIDENSVKYTQNAQNLQSNDKVDIQLQDCAMQQLNKISAIKNSRNNGVVAYKRSSPTFLTCFLCHLKFENKNQMNEHLKTHALDCNKCNITFKTYIGLRKHLKKHTSQESLDHSDGFIFPQNISECKKTCKKCGKSFQYRASMLRHLKRHSSPPQSCIYCDFVPDHHSKMAQHMEENHSHLKNITCTACGKTFFKQSNLRLHMVVHSGMKKHICEICGMSFALACNLTAHHRLHTGERPYTCSHCGRGFTQQSALRSHEACHSDKRDHTCVDCGAAFSRSGALRNHRKRHSSIKSFECTLCGKAFTFSSERKRHMTIHTGDKNHECDVCGRRFSRSTNLKVHRKIHTGETPYMCSLCGKGFIQLHCLKTHMNVHSSKNPMLLEVL